jgi:hypothetical protein
MGTPIKSNIPLEMQEGEYWNWRNVVIDTVCLLVIAMLVAYLSGMFELPPLTSFVLCGMVGFFTFDALTAFLPLKTWEVRNVRRPQI